MSSEDEANDETWHLRHPGNAPPPEDDLVNHPNHYQIDLPDGRRVEVIDILEARFSDDALLWQVGKYLLRAGHKSTATELQDLQKLRVYLNRKIGNLEQT